MQADDRGKGTEISERVRVRVGTEKKHTERRANADLIPRSVCADLNFVSMM